ncbi:MAG TPA: HDOD domain-containing protein [Azospira sp.]|nr:HDOD domain-containing protein [Azospira sp.]
MDKHEVFKALAADVAQGELAFPTSAQVAMKVRQALDDPECHIEAAAQLVQAEPLLAARVVAMANSVTYNRSGRDITDVRTSVARLGFRTVRSLAVALITRQLAGTPTEPALQKLAGQLWEHTAHVASLAHVIARRVTKVDPETAMFAGIVHEVGGFYLISRAKDYPGLLDGDFAEWLEGGEIEVGRAVLKLLEVPAPVQEAIDAYWDGYMAMPAESLGDTLLLAEYLAPVPSPLHRTGQEQSQAQASSIDMAIGEETLSSILAESAEEVGSLTGALQF